MNLSYEIERLNHHLPAQLGETKASLLFEFIMNYPSMNTRTGYLKDIINYNDFLVEQFNIFDDLLAQTNHILAYREYLLTVKNLSKKTINRKISAIKSYYDFLYDKGMISVDPASKVKLHKVNNSIVTNYLDEKYVTDYFNLPVNLNKGDQLLERVVCRILFVLGVRNSSIRDLRIKDLIINDGSYALRFTIKGGEQIIREIPEVLVNELGAYLSWCENKEWDMSPEYYLLRGTRGSNKENRKLCSKTINDIVAKMIKKTGAKGSYSSHTGRVNVIVKAEQVEDIYMAKEYVSHKSVVTTERYRSKGPNSSDKFSHNLV